MLGMLFVAVIAIGFSVSFATMWWLIGKAIDDL